MKRILPILLCLVFVLGTVVSVSAADAETYNYNGVTLPYPPDELIDTEYDQFLLMKENSGSYTLIASYNRLWVDGSTLKLKKVTAEEILRLYTYNNSTKSWSYFGTSGDAISKETSLSYTGSFWASYDLLNSETYEEYVLKDGNFLFPLPRTPMHQVVGQVVGETLHNQALPKLGTELMTIVVCSVSCLALLIGLSLFGKRSLLYRN